MNTGLELYERFWGPGAQVVSDMERHGIRLDVERAEQLFAQTDYESGAVEEQLNDWAKAQINWQSPKQVAQILYGTTASSVIKGGPIVTPKGFELPPISGNLRAVTIRKEGEAPTSEAAIDWLKNRAQDNDREALELLLEYKKLVKLRSFYETLPQYVGADGRIHPQLRASTETGRLSCKNPNLQQQPPEARDLFIADPGHVLLCLDYAGLEWRILGHILAHRYDDWSLIDEIKAGIDPHSATALKMFALPCSVEQVKTLFPKERAAGKILNYSINYGKTPEGLAVQLRIPVWEAKKYIEDFYRARPGIKRWHKDCVELARGTGLSRTLLGRWRYIEGINSCSRWQREKAERLAMNTPIQASAMDIVLVASLRCNPAPHPDLVRLGWYSGALDQLGARQILQVHDELIFECPESNAAEAFETAKSLMEHAMEGIRPFLCPLEVTGGYGVNWKEAGHK